MVQGGQYDPIEVDIEKVDDRHYIVHITCYSYFTNIYATCFDSQMRLKSILFGGNLIEDGTPDKSMVEFSLDGITYTKICGHRQMLKVQENIWPVVEITFHIKINCPDNMDVSKEQLKLVIIPLMGYGDLA